MKKATLILLIMVLLSGTVLFNTPNQFTVKESRMKIVKIESSNIILVNIGNGWNLTKVPRDNFSNTKVKLNDEITIYKYKREEYDHFPKLFE